MGAVIVIFILLFLFFIFVSIKRNEETVKENEKQVTKKLDNKNFKATRVITSYQTERKNEIRIDSKGKKIAIVQLLPYQKIITLKFSDIVDCEILEDSNTVMKGGVGRAVVGGAIAGGVGAIVGANTRKSKNVVNSLKIRIVTQNVSNSLVMIDLITSETNKETTEYKNAIDFANKVYATIISIINSNERITNDNVDNNENATKTASKKNKKTNSESSNNLEKIKQLAELKDKGIITQEEFEESKKKILSKL